ncbi:sensor histidine kinase [Trebonia kvetii]|nr:sensor histidine kinase [Trebonia kvetii]
MGSQRDMSQQAGDPRSSAYPAYPGPTAQASRPPLTKRMRRGHWIAIDCAAGGFIAVSTTVVGTHATDSARTGAFPLALLMLISIFFPVALRRLAPIIAFGVLLALGVLFSVFGSAVTAAIYLAAAFVLYTVTVESRRRTGFAALGLLLAVMLALVGVSTAVRPRADAGTLIPVGLASVIAWMTGYSVRQRRLYVVTLQHQAANSAVAEERLRIARELHDVVAHSMSVIAVQAGYGQYVIDASPDGAKNALGAIQATSRDALEEMRRMLGVLRQQDVTPAAANGGPAPGGLGTAGVGTGDSATGGPAVGQLAADGRAVPRPAPLAPAPGLAGLDRLVRRTCGAGVRVTVQVSGAVRPAPAGVDLSAYRIIQEALTNVVRHAGTGAVCVVSLAYTDADLVIRVTDDGGLPGLAPSGVATAGTGHGIIGMRERVHLCGGTFAVGPVPEGGFQVTAVLPLPIGTAPGGAPGPGVAEIPGTIATPAAADMAGITFASHGGRG